MVIEIQFSGKTVWFGKLDFVPQPGAYVQTSTHLLYISQTPHYYDLSGASQRVVVQASSMHPIKDSPDISIDREQ